MRFLLDEGLPHRAVAALQRSGIEAWHVYDLGLTSAPDAVILAEAVERQAVVVAYDSDFHRQLALTGAMAPSVIRLRDDAMTPDQLARLLIDVVAVAGPLLEQGGVISVAAMQIRGRPLPIIK